MDTHAQGSSTPQVEKSLFTPSDLKEYCKASHKHLLKPFLPKVSLAALVGVSDCGKSTFARQLAISVAAKQTTFLGFDLTTTTGNVLYLCTEDSHEDTLEVLEMQAQAMGLSFADISTLTFLFDTSKWRTELEAYLKKNQPDLVVIDGWGDIMIGDSNAYNSVRQNMNPLWDLGKRHKCCILLLHHTSKKAEHHEADKNRINGSQAFEAKVRCVIDLKKGDDEKLRFLRVVKANGLPPAMKKVSYVLELNDTRTFNNTGKTINKNSALPVPSIKFPIDIWLPRYRQAHTKEGSIAAARQYLVSIYGQDVPSPTWYKENQDKVVGRSDTLGDNTDRPKEGDEEPGDIAV